MKTGTSAGAIAAVGLLGLVTVGWANAYFAVEPAVATPAERRIVVERDVPGARADVWHAWTTNEGVRTFFAPDSNVELRLEGPYEIFFNPDPKAEVRGAQDCKVLSYLTNEMVSFTWSAPPLFPELRKQRSFVVVQLSDAGANRTHVRLVHAGFGPGEEWNKVADYFEKAWPTVMDKLQRRFESGPIDWSALKPG